MRSFAILSIAVLALGFLGADAQEERCPTVVEGFNRDPSTFQNNFAQDYCSQFRKGGEREGELGQADGTQIFTGICSNTPQGEIPVVDNMPSTLIKYPRDGQKIKKNMPFTVKVLTHNFVTGFFSNATNQYNVFPQELNENGFIQGHQHVTIQYLGKNRRSEKIPKATDFAFFKGLNEKGEVKGAFATLTTDVTIGLPKKGIYRCCTLMASFSHQCPVLPKAQRGASDDCIRFEIV